ncbi:MAG: NAD(P)-dependent alcohol dehydrogenase, partial [Terriglobia bacterium]
MKASVYTMYGPPDVIRIQEVEKPVSRAHEVLIRTIATTVNRSDTGIRSGKPFFVRFFFGLVRPKRTVLGSEFAGEVEAVGEAVKTFEVGDRVFGLTGDKFGAHAEYISLPEDAAILAKPTNMDFEEAAAVCDGLMLAWNYLGKVDVRAGTSILIYGASGSIGTAGIQLARALGAEVTAVCGTKSVELARSLGANLVIDYMEKDFTAHGKVYDFVFDAVGKTTFFRCRKLLKKGGVYFATDLG